MTETRAATLIVEIEGRSTNLEGLLKRVQADLLKVSGESQRTQQSTDRLGATQRKAAGDALRQAQALAQLARAEGDTAGAVTILKSALERADKSTTAAIRAQTQLAGLQTKLRSELQGTKSAFDQLSATAGTFSSALGALGFGVGIAAIGQFALAAGQQANQLEKTRAVLRAVAGDSATYADVTRIAASNQQLLGGSLQANLAPLQQFLFIANRTGTSLGELNEVAQLLAATNPLQGISGAGTALSEVLSGDLTSIVERFNLPRAAIRTLINESDNAGEVLAGITVLLGAMGVTAETVAAGLDTNAAAYDRLGAAASNLTTEIGGLLANALAPAANGLTDFANRTAAAVEQLQQAGGVNAAQFAPLIQASYEALTGAVRVYADAQIAAGASGGEAVAKAQGYAQTLDAIALAQGAVTERWDGGTVAADALGARLTALAGTGDANRLAVESLALAYDGGRLTAEDLASSLTGLETAQLAATDAAAADTAAKTDQAAATIDVSASLLSQADATLAAEQQSVRLAQAEQVLASLGSQVASGLITASSAALVLAQRYGIASGEALRLIQMQATLARTQAVAAAGYGGVPEGYLGAASGRGVAPSNGVLKQIAAENTVAASQYKAAVADFAATEAKAAKAGGGGKAKAKGKGAAEKELEQQRAAEEKYQEQRLVDQQRIAKEIEQNERAHADKMLDIQKEFEERSLDQQQKNEISKRRSKLSFYEALLGSDLDQGAQQALSAQYEAANVEAEKLAQQGKQAQAAEYRALKAEQLKAEIEYQQAVKAAREKGDKEALQQLEALAALRRDAEQAELNDLATRGDQNVNARDEATNEEGARYAEQQVEIGTAAEEASKRQIAASVRTQEETAREIAQLQAKADLLTTINAQKNGAPGTPVAPAATPAAPATAVAPAAAPGAPAAPAASAPDLIGALDQVRRAVESVEKAVRAAKPNFSPGG